MSIKEELFSERLILRPLRKDDFEAVHDWASLPDNVRFMDWGPNNEEDTLEFVLSAKAGYDFAVTLKSNGKVIGSCGIYPTKKETAEVGWN